MERPCRFQFTIPLQTGLEISSTEDIVASYDEAIKDLKQSLMFLQILPDSSNHEQIQKKAHELSSLNSKILRIIIERNN